MSSRQQLLTKIGLIALFSFCYINIPAASATLLAVNKGWCLTYDQSRPGTLVSFSRCRSSDARQNSWQLLTGPGSTTTMICISGSQRLCAGIGINGRMYLMKRNPFLIAQQWRKMSGNRFTNVLSGPNFCAEAIENRADDYYQLLFYGNDDDWRIPPRYIGMRPCSDSYQQMILNVSVNARASFQSYFLWNAAVI